METLFLVILNLACLSVVQGEKKVCFAPVICSVKDVTNHEWMVLDSKSQCQNKYSKETNSPEAALSESQIKALINESVAKVRSELTSLLDSKPDTSELKQLKKEMQSLNKTLNQVNARLEREFAGIHETLRLLNDSLQQKIAKENQTTVCTQDGAMTYQNKCYWFVLHNSADVNFARAQNLCSQGGGKPADILSQEHYVMVESKFKELSTTTKWFWLGMKINPANQVVTLSTGTKAPYLKWYLGWPLSTSSYTVMTVQLTVPSSPDGMFHRDPTATCYGVLCQA